MHYITHAYSQTYVWACAYFCNFVYLSLFPIWDDTKWPSFLGIYGTFWWLLATLWYQTFIRLVVSNISQRSVPFFNPIFRARWMMPSIKRCWRVSVCWWLTGRTQQRWRRHWQAPGNLTSFSTTTCESWMKFNRWLRVSKAQEAVNNSSSWAVQVCMVPLMCCRWVRRILVIPTLDTRRNCNASSTWILRVWTGPRFVPRLHLCLQCSSPTFGLCLGGVHHWTPLFSHGSAIELNPQQTGPVYIYGPLNYNPVERYFFDRVTRGRPVCIPYDGKYITQLGHCAWLVVSSCLFCPFLLSIFHIISVIFHIFPYLFGMSDPIQRSHSGPVIRMGQQAKTWRISWSSASAIPRWRARWAVTWKSQLENPQ